MKIIWKLYLALLFCSTSLYAQKDLLVEKQVLIDDKIHTVYKPPTDLSNAINVSSLAAGDDCNQAIPITVNGNPVTKSLSGATSSGITPKCATSSPVFDTWFVTNADENGYLQIGFSIPNNEEKEFGFTVWTDCSGNPNLTKSCDNAPIKFDARIFNGNFSPNQTVYIQVWSYQSSSQEVTLTVESPCNILFTSGKTDFTCNPNNATYSQNFKLDYYTIQTNPTIEVRDSNFQTFLTLTATSNPFIFTIPNLPANGQLQRYYIKICNSNYRYTWQAPNSDCTINGDKCSNAIMLSLEGYNQICENLSNASLTEKTPFCADNNKGAIKDFWFKAQADSAGTIRLRISPPDYKDTITTNLAVYDDCESPTIIECIPISTYNSMYHEYIIYKNNRIPNKMWYFQLWAYEGEEQDICVEASPECSIQKVTFLSAECTSDTTFTQKLEVEHFNIGQNYNIRVRDPAKNYATIMETPLTNSPQTISIPNLKSNVAKIDLSISTDNHDCHGRFVSNLPIPDCANGKNCPNDLTISGYPNLMNYQSANTITTEENTVIYTNTYFKAETSITLKPGFAVRSYAEFKASIAPCPSSMTFAEAETQIIKQPLAIKTPIIEKNNLKVYPNPFQQRAMINYQLKEAGNVSIYLFDIAGKMLKQLAQTHQEKGDYQLTLDADYLQSGLYFIHANLNGTLQTEKIYLIKGDRN